ncbi:importin subunit beta-1 [Nematocida sp. AWRm80]|nr:importin subunit beta-1 [Nematocida sp. AWRm80]
MRERLHESLVKLHSVNNEERKESEEYIIGMAQRDFNRLMNGLLEVLLNDPGKNVVLEMSSAIVLKTFFVWESQEKKKEVTDRWMSLLEPDREKIKGKLIQGLEVCTDRTGEMMAQCLGAVAKLEVVNGRWLEVFSHLNKLCTGVNNPVMRRNVIETIGILCMDTTEINPNVIIRSSGSILNMIFQETRSSENKNKYTAFVNLQRCLEFISYNMRLENECKAIVEAVYAGCKLEETEIASEAMKCFCSMLRIYYAQVEKYLGMGFAHLGMEFLFSDQQERVLGGIAMWTVIADHETEHGGKNIYDTFTVLVSRLLVLIRNEDLEQSYEWTMYKAAASLLAQISHCAPEKIKSEIISKSQTTMVPLPTRIEEMLVSNNPIEFEGGMIALGSVINEDTVDELLQVIVRTLGHLFNSLDSEHSVIIDTGLWLYENLFRHAYTTIEQTKQSEEIFKRIISIISSGEEISINAAWAFSEIVSSIRLNTHVAEYDKRLIFSNYPQILNLLIDILNRLKEDDYTFMVALSSAISQMVQAAPKNYLMIILSLTGDLARKIAQEIDKPRINEEISRALISILHSCIITLEKQAVIGMQKEIIWICLCILNNPRLEGLFTDIYLLLGGISDKLGVGLSNHSENLMPYILRDLDMLRRIPTIQSEASILSTSLFTFIGSMATAMQLGFSVYVDKIVPMLLELFHHPGLPLEPKSTAIATLADISLSVGKVFEKYHMAMINLASNTVSIGTHELEDSITLLLIRESILDLLLCVIQASNGKSHNIIQSIDSILESARKIVTETNDSACVIKTLYLISDIWILYGQNMSPTVLQQLEATWIKEFISAKAMSSRKDVQEAAITTKLQISSMYQQQY